MPISFESPRRFSLTCWAYTAAAGGLQRDGIIDYVRGTITVLDRAGLEAAACGCYASGERR